MTAKLITVGGKEVQALDEKGQPIETAAYDKLTNDQKLSARERGIRAQAKGEAAKETVARVLKQLGVRSFEELTEVTHLRAQLKQSISPEEERKHVKGAFGWGVVWGIPAGMVLAVIFVAAYTASISGFGHDMALTGAAVQASNRTQPYVCQPGDRMPDGHVCGVPRTP